MSDIPTIINVWTIYGEPRLYSNGEKEKSQNLYLS